MWRWFKWVLIVIGLVLIAFLGFQYYKFFIGNRMSQDLITRAEKSFVGGITINDPKNDFLTKADLGKEMENGTPANFPYLDLKSLTLGTDDQYLFVKIRYYDEIPSSPDTTDGGTITGVGAQLDLMDERGWNNAVLATEFGWVPKIKLFSLNTWYLTGPTGKIWPEEARFEKQNFDSKIFGGKGYDYVMGAYPLDKLGLKTGDKINFSLGSEAGSEKYSHAGLDYLLGHGKYEGYFTWVIGSNEYVYNEDFKYVESNK